MNIVLNGTAMVAFRAAEAQAIWTALGQLESYSTDDLLPTEADCASLLEATQRLAQGLVASEFLLVNDTGSAYPSILGSSIPVVDDWNAAGPEDAETVAIWNANPELARALVYAPGGMLLPAADAAPIRQIVGNMTAIEQGRCGFRVRWGLVGAVALLGGAAIYFGGLALSRGRK